MNRREIETLLLQERDGALTPEQRAVLATALLEFKREAAQVVVPDVDGEWRMLRARLRSETQPATAKAIWPRVLWLGSSLAAAAALALVFFNDGSVSVPAPVTTGMNSIAASETARADYVEAGDADASTLVYVDKDSGWLVVWASNPDMPASS